jgi:MarR family transcriptional regulator, organic hydroperoxide resistance regulator
MYKLYYAETLTKNAKILFVYTNKPPLLCATMKLKDGKYGMCLYFTSAALARKVEKLATESWKKVNLVPSHAYLLMTVLEEPGIQPTMLSNILHLQPSTITRFIEKLEEKKLLVRTTEGKITNVYPTPKAKDLQPRLKECLHHFYQKYCALLGKEESNRLVEDMAKIADKLEA